MKTHVLKLNCIRTSSEKRINATRVALSPISKREMTCNDTGASTEHRCHDLLQVEGSASGVWGMGYKSGYRFVPFNPNVDNPDSWLI